MMLRFLFSLFLLVASTQLVFADNKSTGEPVKIGIVHCCVPEDSYLLSMYNLLVHDASQRPGVELLTRSANGNADTQLRQIQNLIDKGAKSLLISVVSDDDNERQYQESVMNLLIKNHIPAVFYVKKMPDILLFKDKNSFFVSTLAVETAIEQGQLVIKHWLQHPEFDRNHDGTIQYVILRGTKGNFDAETRTKWIQATLNHYPGKSIHTDLLDIGYADWRTDRAEEIVDRWLDEKKPIEVIVANDDGMALGAVKSLEKHHMKLPVYGIHAFPEALQKIRNGEMMGTVSQNMEQQAREMVNLAINLAEGKPVTTNTREKIFEHEMMLPNIAIDKDNVNQFIKK